MLSWPVAVAEKKSHKIKAATRKVAASAKTKKRERMSYSGRDRTRE